jgi:phospholipid transport system substrate-binding protein
VLILALAVGFVTLPAGAGEPVANFIDRLGSDAIGSLAGKDLTPQQREDRFRALFSKNFDVPRISRFTLGRYARKASKEELKTYASLFEDMAVLTYSGIFAEYSGQKLEVKKVLGAPSDRYAMVVSEVRMPDGGQPVRLEWQVLVARNKYAVVDIRVEGVSMALAQRDEYTSFLEKNKGDMGLLIQELRARVEALRKKNAAS